MAMQDVLSALIENLAIAFGLIMVLDFVSGLGQITQPVQSGRFSTLETEALAAATSLLEVREIPEPWLLSVDEVPAIEVLPRAHFNAPKHPTQLPLLLLPGVLAAATSSVEVEEIPDPWLLSVDTISSSVQLLEASIKPLLLLPPGAELSFPAPGKPSLEELLAGVVDIDKLQLRPARKIAKALEVAQKVNGKDQPLSWLRAQIKAKLQLEEVPAEAIEAITQELRAS